MGFISKTVVRRKLHDRDPDVDWWRSLRPAQRIAHVQELRSEASGRPQDIADVAVLKERAG